MKHNTEIETGCNVKNIEKFKKGEIDMKCYCGERKLKCEIIRETKTLIFANVWYGDEPRVIKFKKRKNIHGLAEEIIEDGMTKAVLIWD